MVLLNNYNLNRDEREHNRKIADYLNRHPMFSDAGCGKICKEDFFIYISTDNRLWKAVDGQDRLGKIGEAIWISGDYAGISEDDCDWFLDRVEKLWCEYHDVQSSGFFDRPDPLPVVPRGLLKIPERL